MVAGAIIDLLDRAPPSIARFEHRIESSRDAA
jgi:hypothetical protein